MSNNLQCTLGVASRTCTYCLPIECARCGFERAERRRRNKRLENIGLQKNKDGNLYLDISRFPKKEETA